MSAARVGVIELFEIHGAILARREYGPGMVRIDPFAPAELGPITLRNRVIKAATFEGRTPKRIVTPELIEFHRRFAAGGVGMTTVAYCAVTRAGSTDGHQIVLDNPDVGAGLRDLTDAVHAEGAAIAAQIGHAGPVANPMGTKSPALAPSRVFSPLGMRRTQAATAHDIATIVEQYAHGAGVLRDAGFDAIEVHIGHGYLLSAFLSPRLNKRTDEYGGSLENRARFPLDVVRAVRAAAGSDIAVTAKINMADGVRGGFWLDESVEFATDARSRRFARRADPHRRQLVREPDVPLPRRSAGRGDGRDVPRHPEDRDQDVRREVLQGVSRSKRRTSCRTPGSSATRCRCRSSCSAASTASTRSRTRSTTASRFVQIGRALLREPELLLEMQKDPKREGLCIHCNKCMPTIYTGTRCVLV